MTWTWCAWPKNWRPVMADLTPNIPEVVAEIREKFDAYEQALID